MVRKDDDFDDFDEEEVEEEEVEEEEVEEEEEEEEEEEPEDDLEEVDIEEMGVRNESEEEEEEREDVWKNGPHPVDQEVNPEKCYIHSYTKEGVGRFMKKTKLKITWELVIEGEEHTIAVYHSQLSGKKVVLLDGDTEYVLARRSFFLMEIPSTKRTSSSMLVWISRSRSALRVVKWLC